MAKIPNDQFYTKRNVSHHCFEKVLEYKELINQNSKILEPSAGTGSFMEAFLDFGFQKENILAYDIEPKHSLVKKADFLEQNIEKDDNLIACGNPPFGRRSSLAISFFNKCAECCSTIAFIVPVQFRKYGVQSKLNNNFKLIYDELLDPVSFENNGKDLNVRCCFQIWTKKEGFKDLRIKEAPPVSHEDFEMYLYNNTPQALKFFDYDWDFAVPRQGFYDYSLRIKDKKELNPRVQYMFFKAKDKETLKKLESIDFNQLSLKNTTIKGFGKADIVEEYERMEKINAKNSVREVG